MTEGADTQRPEPETPENGAAPPSRRRSRLARYALRFVQGLAVLLLLVVLFVAWLHTSSGSEVLRARLQTRLSGRVTTAITIGKLEFSLFSGVTLHGLTVMGTDDRPAIVISRAFLMPNLGDIVSGKLALDEVIITGVTVDVHSRPDGTTNLPTTTKEPPPRILVRKLSVADVDVHLTKPDGLDVVVDKLRLDGAVDVTTKGGPRNVTLAAHIGRLAFARPAFAATVTDFDTKVSVDIARGGAGKIALGATTAGIRVVRDGVAPVDTKLSLPSASIDLTPERMILALETLELAALSLAAAKVEVARKTDGSIERPTDAQITKLRVKADDVEALAGRRVLAGDVTVDVRASGPAEAFVPEVRVATPGGEIVLRGKLDLRDPKALVYEATLDAKSLDVKRIYASDKLPPLLVGEVGLSANGERREGAPPKVRGALRLRDVKVRDVVIDAIDLRARLEDGLLTIESLDVRALGQKVEAAGSYRLEGKDVDVAITASARVGELVRELRTAGVLKKPPSPLLSALSLGRPLKIHVRGKADGEMTLQITDVDARVAGGAARGTVTARIVRTDPAASPGPDGKPAPAIVVRDVEADIELRGVSLTEVGRLRGKPLPVAGRASGRVKLRGTPDAPIGDVDLVVDLVKPAPSGSGTGTGPEEPVGTLRVKAEATAARFTAKATLVDATGGALLTATADGARAGRGVVPPLHVKVDVPERSLSAFAPLLRPEIAEKLPPDARISLHATVTGEGRRTHIEADVDAKLAPAAAPIAVRARATFAGPVSSVSTAPVDWALDVDLPETEITALPLPPDRARDLRGRVSASLHAKGNRDDATGELAVSAQNLTKGILKPVTAHVRVALREDGSDVTIDGAMAEVRIIEGKIATSLAGRGLLAAVRGGGLDGLDPALDGQLRIPDRTLEAWSAVVPSAHELPGHAGATLDIKGRARNPELALHARYDGYPTLDGKEGTLVAEANVRRERAHVAITANDAITFSAEVSPQEILVARTKDGGQAHLHASLEGGHVPLAALLPRSERAQAMKPEGFVDAHMIADATLVFRGEARELGALSVRGPITLTDAAFAIPTTNRRVHHVALRIEGDGDKLAVRALQATESDRDEPHRTVDAQGDFDLRTRELSLRAKTHRVLLSGGSFGELDAPRAALTADLGLYAALSGPTRRVTVDVHALELISPDRQPRAAQQEVTSVGDLLTGVDVGKLPTANTSAPANETSQVAGAREEDKTLEVVIRVPNAIHVMQRPLDLYAKGEVHIDRYGSRSVLSGGLQALDGSLLIGGREHRLSSGNIRMTSAGAVLDLHFKREPHVAALRDMTTAGDNNVYAHMIGVLGKQKLTFSGQSDGLFEALAVENIGRVRMLSTPDAPLVQTPQLPQVAQIRQTAFMSANLSHLAFLDRMNTYADPNAGRFAYGRFEALEAERYSRDGTRRFRTTSRSPVIGQSEAEVEGSLLFQNNRRVVSGVGVVAGTRIGGGPVIFWEWSSAD